MASLNKVMLIGNLGNDPEMKYTQNGSTIANFSIATSERWKDKNGEQQEKTEWHRIVAFDKKAEIIEKYLRKGSSVYIEGKLQTRSWEDQSGGGKKYSTEIVLFSLEFLDRKDSGNSGGSVDAAHIQMPSAASIAATSNPTPNSDFPPF